MFRFLILSGYFEWMMYLQVSGKLNQYINIHYIYLVYLTMALSLLLALVQLKLWVEQSEGKERTHAHHGHEHGGMKRSQKMVTYLLLSLPLIAGTLFPTISLDTTIVEAKGFSFPVSKESVGDPEMNTQYLKPDTSIYYNKDDYDKQMEELLAKYQENDVLQVTDENYLEVMELIYTYPNTFVGKKLSYEGFDYQTTKDQTYNFLFRFGIIHCVADSGVFGLMIHFPENEKVNNNQWLHVEGTIELEYFEPFKRQLPALAVEKVQPIATPDNQYVYRSF
ncbi:TIGR03943 family putative permease subunit [Enterococcus sp. AZ109]|uniref:TIGR03943 family putative permease subunit n=1 Tax=Enterococcus sp. AZ109 TaxID=2774634 RepID=UPI003F202FE0